jgi:hypothetical protein
MLNFVFHSEGLSPLYSKMLASSYYAVKDCFKKYPDIGKDKVTELKADADKACAGIVIKILIM